MGANTGCVGIQPVGPALMRQPKSVAMYKKMIAIDKMLHAVDYS